MRSRRRRATAALAVALAAVAEGCATNPLPSDRSVSQEGAISSGRGAYTRAIAISGGQVSGELIAIGGGRAVILDDHERLVALTYGDLYELRLGVHDNNKVGFALWTVLGALSTISHGFFLVFSAPTWLVVGGVSTSSEAQSGIFECRPRDETNRPDSACLELAARFARFPQGLPPGVGRAQLLGLPAPKGPAPSPPAPSPPPSPVPPPGQAPPPAPAPPAAPTPTPPAFPKPYEPGV